MEEHDDDKPIGRVLSRREMLTLLGGASVAIVAGTGFTNLGILQQLTPTPSPTATALPSCVVRPQKTEGPYFVDNMLNRSDIRIEPSDGRMVDGVRVRLVVRVFELSGTACVPVEGAQVDLWHCDALGTYSGVAGNDESFLRGYQITDAQGIAEFITVYPGWYRGRAVHMHFKIRTDPTLDSGYELTSQFFFTEEMNDLIHDMQPYSQKGTRDVLNAEDGIYGDDGEQLVLELVEDTESEEGGYTATFDIALDYSEASTTTGGGGGQRPNGGGTPPAPRATATPTPKP